MKEASRHTWCDAQELFEVLIHTVRTRSGRSGLKQSISVNISYRGEIGGASHTIEKDIPEHRRVGPAFRIHPARSPKQNRASKPLRTLVQLAITRSTVPVRGWQQQQLLESISQPELQTHLQARPTELLIQGCRSRLCFPPQPQETTSLKATIKAALAAVRQQTSKRDLPTFRQIQHSLRFHGRLHQSLPRYQYG